MSVTKITSYVYRSPKQSIGECPEIGIKMQNFMVKFFSSLPEDRQGTGLRASLLLNVPR